MILKNRNYEKEIIEILKLNGGCFKGFNKLQKRGEFHSTSLQNCLERLEEQNIIIINKSKTGRKFTEYCLIIPHFGFKLKLNERDIMKISKQKENAESKDERLVLITHIVRLLFHKYKNVRVGLLCSELIDYPSDPTELKQTQERYWNMIINELQELPEKNRRTILNQLFEEYPDKSPADYFKR